MSDHGIARFLAVFLIVLASLVIGSLAGWQLGRDTPPDPPFPEGTAEREDVRAETGEEITPDPEETGGTRPAGGEEDPPAGEEVTAASITEDRSNAIVRAARVVGPCVVSINVVQTQIVERGFAFDDFWSDFFFPHRYRREVQSLGSGFIVSGKGHILTNEHVVHAATRILVTLEDGRQYEAEVVGTDTRTDLALLRIEAGDLPVAPLGDSDDLVPGEWVIAIGNPFGYLLDDPQPSVTVGVVSALQRDVKPERGRTAVFVNMIQTDASINPGNSGGPLSDSRGMIVGVNTFIFTKSGGSLGMGFAVPINRAKRVVKDLVKYGQVRWPWIGIQPQELTKDLRDGLKIEEGRHVSGIIVADIDGLSPAEEAGLTRGDIITDLDGSEIRSVLDWEGEILDVPVGEVIRIGVLRKGEYRTFRLETRFLPTDVAKKQDSGIGVVLTDLTPTVKSQLGVVHEEGAVVLRVKDRQLEEDGGILPFDVILKVNNTNIRSAEEAVDALDNLQRANRNLLVIERGGKLIYRSLITR